jgi:hypothetical protein
VKFHSISKPSFRIRQQPFQILLPPGVPLASSWRACDGSSKTMLRVSRIRHTPRLACRHPVSPTTPNWLGGRDIPSPGKRGRCGHAGRALRKPWYAFWKWVERGWYAGRNYSCPSVRVQGVHTLVFNRRQLLSLRGWCVRHVARGPLTKSADRCYMLYQLSRSALRFSADWAECGVHTGGIAICCLSRRCRPRRLHLFDTFKGVPSTARDRT